MEEQKKGFLSQGWVIVAIAGAFLLGGIMIFACCGGIAFMNARQAAAAKKAELEAEQKATSLEKNDYDHFWKDGPITPKRLQDIPLPKIDEQPQFTIPPSQGPVELRKPDSELRKSDESKLREMQKSFPDIPPSTPPEQKSNGNSQEPASNQN